MFLPGFFAHLFQYSAREMNVCPTSVQYLPEHWAKHFSNIVMTLQNQPIQTLVANVAGLQGNVELTLQ